MASETDKKKHNRFAIWGAGALACLLIVCGIAFNIGIFASNFDPSNFLEQNFANSSSLNQGVDSSYLNDDNQTQGDANVQDNGDGNQSTPDTTTPDATSALTEGSLAQLIDSNSSNAQGLGQGDSANGDSGVLPIGPGNGGNDGNGGGGGTVPGYDPDQPPVPVKPSAMNGITLLSLNPTGMAVFSTNDIKDSVDAWQNLSNVSIVAVLYDEATGAKWTRTLTYGNQDGYTYTVASESFPITADTKSITVVYYLYGQRYTAEIPCTVGSTLTAVAKDKDDFFEHVSVGQAITEDDVKNHLSITLSGKEIDPNLCQISNFDTTTPGKKQVTISYSGLECTFEYEVSDRSIVFHTPEALKNCDERVWGYGLNEFSVSWMQTRFNGTDQVSETVSTSTFDLGNMTQQLMGDLYWTQDPKGYSLYYGGDPNFTMNYVADAQTGALDDWFVGWATADPAEVGGTVDEAWMAEHIVDTKINAVDMALISAAQGLGNDVHLYPVFRSQTTISSSSATVVYNEHSGDWTQWSDLIEDRAPAQLFTSFTADAVHEGTLEIPRGVTYVSLSPLLSDRVDEAVLNSVTAVNLPSGVAAFDRTMPHYEYPVDFNRLAYDVSVVLPNLSNISVDKQRFGLGTNNYSTVDVEVKHEDGGTEIRQALMHTPNRALQMIPVGGVATTDSIRVPDEANVKIMNPVCVLGAAGKGLELPSTLEAIHDKALTGSAFDEVVFNSAPQIGGRAFAGETSDGTGVAAGPTVKKVIFNTSDVASVYNVSLNNFFNDDENSLESFKQADYHIYVPDEDTLIRYYSAWKDDIDSYFGEGTTAFLLRVDSDEDQGTLVVDDNKVVYRVTDTSKTLVYAPASLEGYYELPSDVTAIAPGAFDECSKLLGLIVNSNDAGKLPELGEYAFGAPNENGYAEPPAVFKVFVASGIQGVDEWKETFKQQYWHINDQEQAENADTLVKLVFEDSYDSYFVYEGSLYADDTNEAGQPERAILRANDQTQGAFTLCDGTTIIDSFAFAGCEDVTLLRNLHNLRVIKSMAFLDCSRLNVVVLPDSLEEVGDCAFAGCSHLEALAFSGQPSFGESVFDQAAIPRVYAPSDLGSAIPESGNGFVDAVRGLGVTDIQPCPIEGGSYKYLNSGGYEETTYRCICVMDANGMLHTTFAGSNLGDAFWNEGSEYGGYYVTLDNSVVEVGEGTFENQVNITSVSGGDNLEKINNRAFKGCTALERLDLGWFSSAVAWFGDESFEGCTSLTTANFPTEWTFPYGSADTFHVGKSAFKGCSSLSATYDPGWGLPAEFKFPAEVKVEIDDEAFKGCSSLTLLDMTSSDFVIGVSAFEDCSGMTTVASKANRQNANLTVSENAFVGCPLTFISLEGSQVTVGANAFAGITGMDAVFVPKAATVDGSAFSGANAHYAVTTQAGGLSAIKFDDVENVDGIMPVSNQNSYVAFAYNEDGTTRTITCSGDNLSYFDINALYDGNYTIGNAAFKDNTNLISASLGGEDYWSSTSVTAIGDEAFMGCINLQDAGLRTATAVTSIGKSAYEGCEGIAALDIPYPTSSIGDYAFKGCTSLQSVNHYCAIDWDGSYLTPCTLGKGAFENCTSLILYDMSDFVIEVGEDCFKGCDNVEVIMYWTGNQTEFGLPKLNGSIFGASLTDNPVPNDCKITVAIDANIGSPITQEQFEAMLTAENGWLPYKGHLSYDSALFDAASGDSADTMALDADGDAVAAGDSVDSDDVATADLGDEGTKATQLTDQDSSNRDPSNSAGTGLPEGAPAEARAESQKAAAREAA